MKITENDLGAVELIQEPTIKSLEAYTYYYHRYKQLYQNIPDRVYREYQVVHSALHSVYLRNIMAHEQGIGKTIQACAIIALLYKLNRPGQIHIIMHSPLGLINWTKELEALNQTKGKWEFIDSLEQMRISNKPIWLYTHDFPKRKRPTNGNRKTISKLLGSTYRPSFVIIDEIHNLLKGSNRTTNLTYIINRARRVLGLSGTISDSNITHLYYILKLIYPQQFSYKTPQQFTSYFTELQSIKTNYLTGSQSKSNRTLRKLNLKRIPEYYSFKSKLVHRVTLQDPEIASTLVLPREEEEVIIISPTESQRDIQKKYLTNHIESIKLIKDSPRLVPKALTLMQPLIDLANFGANKLEEVKKHLGSKTVIFHDKVNIGDLLENHFSIKTYRLHSQQTIEERIDTVKSFESNPDPCVLVSSISISSESIDLVSSDTIIFYDFTWKETKILQAIKRVIRSGNTHDVVKVKYLYTHNLIDEHQYNLYKQKLKSLEQILNYRVSSDIYDEIEEEVEEEETVEGITDILYNMAEAPF